MGGETKGTQAEAREAARALGLERAFEADPAGFARALASARKLAAKRTSPQSPQDEPAHVFRVPRRPPPPPG